MGEELQRHAPILDPCPTARRGFDQAQTPAAAVGASSVPGHPPKETSLNTIQPDSLALQRLYCWERTAPDRLALSQPMGDGAMLDFSWAQVADQVRRMAAHLQAQGWEPGSKVAILSKNCAWWLMSDLAIWMAGHVSVPLYPTLASATVGQILTHSEVRAC
ncbi:MAG: AMP-binding acetyl-CoA synthetase, partial [Comamonadaceae bacterium]